MMSLSESAIAEVEINDCGEELVELRGLDKRLFLDDSEANAFCIGYRPIFLVRQTIARKLEQALRLVPPEFALLVKDAYRPRHLQEIFFNAYVEELRAKNPERTDVQLVAFAAHFVAPPAVAGHPTGGAIDLTLCTQSGTELALGSAYDADAETSGGACYSDCDAIAESEKRHRQVLFRALGSVGFVNYPFEWWHWSYGDRYWAALTGSESALYGALDLSPEWALAAASDWGHKRLGSGLAS